MVFLRKYGVEAIIDGIVLVDTDSVDFETDPTLASGDVKISKDGGALANINTLPAETPAMSGGSLIRVTISATEMQAARIVVLFKDQTNPKAWEDQVIIIESYGDASAQHAFDLDTATQNVNVIQISGDSGAADNLESDYDGTGYNKTNSQILQVNQLGTQAKDDVDTEVDEAIENYKLDHLVAVADSDDVVDDSIIAKLASATGDWSTFSSGSDSLETIANLVTGIVAGIASGLVLTAAEKDRIADHVLRRTLANARASSDGDSVTLRSLLGALSKLINKIKNDGSVLTIYEEDDATEFGTQDVTTSSSSLPITELDTN